MITPRPTYRIVFESIGAALVLVSGLLLFTIGFIANAFSQIFRRKDEHT